MEDVELEGNQHENDPTTKNVSSTSRRKRKLLNRALLVGIFGLLISAFLTLQTSLLKIATSTYSQNNVVNPWLWIAQQSTTNDENTFDHWQRPEPFTEEEVLIRRLGKNESFAACLMVMDENHRLPEWLAYHYQVLPLRHLIIHIDPRSETNVTSLLNEWSYILGNDLTFEEWSEHNFTKNDAHRAKMRVNMSWPFQKRLFGHRLRQSTFYQECGRHLHKEGYHWTIFHDVDEFFTLSYEYFDQMKQVVRRNRAKYVNQSRSHSTMDAQVLMEQPGIALQILHEMRSSDDNSLYVDTKSFPRFKSNQSHVYNSSVMCINVPRARYSSVEIPPDERRTYRSIHTTATTTDDPLSDETSVVIKKNISQHILLNITNLDTMRYRIRETPKGNRQGPGKSIIDLSLVDLRKHKLVRGNAHRPLTDICPKLEAGARYGPPWELYGHRLPFGIHHYYGTLEAFMYKQDWHGVDYQLYRFRKEALLETNLTVPKGVNFQAEKISPFRDEDELCSWLSGFITNVGRERAEYLLRNAQYLPPKSNQSIPLLSS